MQTKIQKKFKKLETVGLGGTIPTNVNIRFANKMLLKDLSEWGTEMRVKSSELGNGRPEKSSESGNIMPEKSSKTGNYVPKKSKSGNVLDNSFESENCMVAPTTITTTVCESVCDCTVPGMKFQFCTNCSTVTHVSTGLGFGNVCSDKCYPNQCSSLPIAANVICTAADCVTADSVKSVNITCDREMVSPVSCYMLSPDSLVPTTTQCKTQIVSMLGGKPLIKFYVNSRVYEGLWNTGSMVCLLSKEWLEREFPKQTIIPLENFMENGDQLSLRSANNSEMHLKGVVVLSVSLPTHNVVVDTPSLEPTIVSRIPSLVSI